jgi:monofunctional biosynthetic peptidoglycan transglycosylase
MWRSRGRIRRRRSSRVLRWVVLAVIALLLVSVTPVVAMRWIDPPTSAFMLQASRGGLAGHAPCREVRYRWIDYAEISDALKMAVITAEDQRFPFHNGFDWESISEALDERGDGERVRGASTLSQQLAKNLFLWPDRSWLRKGLEAYYAALIELIWPKRRILEVYLNVAQFGRCSFGVKAGARALFGKSAAELTRWDAARMAAILPSPVRYRAHPPSPFVRERAFWILDQMRMLGGDRYLDGL